MKEVYIIKASKDDVIRSGAIVKNKIRVAKQLFFLLMISQSLIPNNIILKIK